MSTTKRVLHSAGPFRVERHHDRFHVIRSLTIISSHDTLEEAIHETQTLATKEETK